MIGLEGPRFGLPMSLSGYVSDSPNFSGFSVSPYLFPRLLDLTCRLPLRLHESTGYAMFGLACRNLVASSAGLISPIWPP